MLDLLAKQPSMYHTRDKEWEHSSVPQQVFHGAQPCGHGLHEGEDSSPEQTGI